MKTKKATKFAIIIAACVLALALLIIVAAFIRQAVINSRINDDYTAVLRNPRYHNAVSVDGVHFIKQDITCGYANIEMLAK
jgi:hypothetical protein